MWNNFVRCRRCFSSRSRSFRPEKNKENQIDSQSFIDEYVRTINQYRFNLGLAPIVISESLNRKAKQRAEKLAQNDRIETSEPSQLFHENQPIGETFAPVFLFSNFQRVFFS